jgi:hypothetical protein
MNLRVPQKPGYFLPSRKLWWSSGDTDSIMVHKQVIYLFIGKDMKSNEFLLMSAITYKLTN